MCPLGRLDQQSQISPTNGRFDPLQISLSIMIGVDGRARAGIIA